jgi:hypothetical protein
MEPLGMREHRAKKAAKAADPIIFAATQTKIYTYAAGDAAYLLDRYGQRDQ